MNEHALICSAIAFNLTDPQKPDTSVDAPFSATFHSVYNWKYSISFNNMLIFYAEYQRIFVLLHEQFVVSIYHICEVVICEISSGKKKIEIKKKWKMLNEKTETNRVISWRGIMHKFRKRTNIVWIMMKQNQVDISHINGQVDVEHIQNYSGRLNSNILK